MHYANNANIASNDNIANLANKGNIANIANTNVVSRCSQLVEWYNIKPRALVGMKIRYKTLRS